MTRTTFLRFTMRQLSQRRLTDALTFMDKIEFGFGGQKIALERVFPRAILLNLLLLPEGNPTFGQIVGREFQGDLVSRQNADAVTAEPARQVRQDHAFMFELYAEQAAGKLL